MHTRTALKARHALIAPDGHVPSAFPGWSGFTVHVLISPAMGAGFSQFLLLSDVDDASAVFSADENEHAIYMESGSVTAEFDSGVVELGAQGYLFVPPYQSLKISTKTASRMTIYRKAYQKHPDHDLPPVVHGNAADIAAEAFLGNERARLRTLLPIDPRFDFAMNIFTYQPGATLPFVETHIMEHGLLMLEGDGIYRLEDSYYPVHAGDAIWMAPYCPQWFAAIGDVPASYLYHKDIHRIP